jgi:peptide-methionine (S)-S-oxide reductase
MLKSSLATVFVSVLSAVGLTACAQKSNYENSPTFKRMNASASDATASKAPSASTPTNEQGIQTATFGTGCFWCTEAQFQQLDGVVTVASGYSGGHIPNPTYKAVCTGTTGHAEVIQLTYDPAKISYDELLAAFWQAHDPTTLNRQGADEGPQYRSVIFFHNDEQRKKAEDYKQKLNEENAFGKPVVTEISSFSKFYKAEDYHQNYYNENGSQPYCSMVIEPKLDKFKKVFADKLKGAK